METRRKSSLDRRKGVGWGCIRKGARRSATKSLGEDF
jgi:hypothetical protein